MKKILSGRFTAIVFCLSLALACGSCVSPKSYFEASAADLTPPPGFTRVTQSALTGLWQNAEGDAFAFQNDNFRSTLFNEGKPGRYVINPVFDSYLLVFYTDRNVEGSALFGGTFYFDESGNRERRNLDSIFALLSEDLDTLVLDGTIYNKVGN